MDDRQELIRLLADLLEYPGSGLPVKARQCEALLAAQPGAAGDMADFAAFVESEGVARLEEIYTSTFDLNPQCYPYAGYQLFGEDPKRTELMIRLQQGFCATGFSIGSELPDYVPVLMRFLSTVEDEEMAAELREMVLAPSLGKMAGTLEEKQNPYAKAVAAAAAVMSIS